jgi:hypothetical protein
MLRAEGLEIRRDLPATSSHAKGVRECQGGTTAGVARSLWRAAARKRAMTSIGPATGSSYDPSANGIE